MQKYLVVIEKADFNYAAFSPDVPGCITTGETIDETLKNMHEALELYLEETDVFPDSRGLSFYVKEGLLDTNKISEEYLISSIEVPLPAVV